MALTDKNLFAYCDNNPVVRIDRGGQFWESALDVISLGASIVEVCINPTDIWAWAGLVGDTVDLIPFVTGVGEVTRVVKTTVKTVDKAADVLDAANDLYKTADAANDIRKATGSYEIVYKSGKNYVGKGNFKRAMTSAKEHAEGVDDIYEPVNYKALADHYVIRDGYVFMPLSYPYNVFDAVLVRNPQTAVCDSPRLPYSERNLDEHIALINKLEIEKAVIIASDIKFIENCSTLKHLKIIPVDDFGDGFDYSKIKGIEEISVSNCNCINYSNICTLKSLGLSNFKEQDLKNAFSSTELDTLSLIQCKIKSLEGIQKSQKMQCLYLYYNRSLQDISALIKVKRTLRALRIENCPKINDFSVLGELENLELLELSGSNELPSLSFLKKMKKLKTFIFNMNVKDGDLTPCLALSYVYSEKNRKHYNLKDTELPKAQYVRGNETIEKWRRLE